MYMFYNLTGDILDAGKSTIGGQIMALTGMVDKRTLEKYEREAKERSRESWYLSWALDTNQEGKLQGYVGPFYTAQDGTGKASTWVLPHGYGVGLYNVNNHCIKQCH